MKISDQLPGVPLERRSPLGRPIVAALVQIACIGWVALMVYLTITSMAGVFR